MYKSKRIGLSLSGGGYRAAAFHLGTLQKLNELKILDKVDIISTISGGSIAGVYYILRRNNFTDFEKTFKESLKRSVLFKIVFSFRILMVLVFLSFYTSGIYFLTNEKTGYYGVIIGLLAIVPFLTYFHFFFFPITSLKVKAYEEIFFGKSKLADLPDLPEIAINATNLETGTLWTYSKRKVSDSSYEYPKDGGEKILFKASEFPLSLAVASSTAVPVIFEPIEIQKDFFVNPNDFDRVFPSLSDGGVYDNQGIHKLTQSNSSYFCEIIICSDGSMPFEFKFSGKNSFQVLNRATNVMMRKIKSMQFIRDVYGKQYEIAYYSLDWGYENCLKHFIQNLKEKKILQMIIDYHQFPIIFLEDIDRFKKELLELIKLKINFEQIIKNGLTEKEIIKVCKIRTGLSSLSNEKIDLLTRHAATLTEIQIKLYCPTILI